MSIEPFGRRLHRLPEIQRTSPSSPRTAAASRNRRAGVVLTSRDITLCAFRPCRSGERVFSKSVLCHPVRAGSWTTEGFAAREKHAERSKPVVFARRTPRVLTSRHGSGRTFPAFGSFPRVGGAMIPARMGRWRTHLEKTPCDERGSRGVVGLSTAQDRR